MVDKPGLPDKGGETGVAKLWWPDYGGQTRVAIIGWTD